MTRSFPILVLAAVIVSASGAGFALKPLPWGARVGDFRLALLFRSAEFRPGKRFRFNLYIRNHSAVPVAVLERYSCSGYSWLRVVARDAQGREHRLALRGARKRCRRNRPVMITVPARSYARIQAESLVPPLAPGTYWVTASGTLRGVAGRPLGSVKSNAIRLRIP